MDANAFKQILQAVREDIKDLKYCLNRVEEKTAKYQKELQEAEAFEKQLEEDIKRMEVS